MKVLLTGCAGFIGSKVAEHLARAGHEVVGVDNLDSAYPVILKRWRLEKLKAVPGFSFRPGSILDPPFLEGLWEGAGPFETVVNLAARAGVRQSLRNPHGYYEVNLLGTLNLLELCRHRGVPTFVLASTSSLYGEGPRPFREDQPTDRPLSPYAASKKAAEVLAYTYHRLFGLDVAVLRYFTVYGPAGRPDMSIFRFVRRIAEGLPIVVYGDGTQERDFTYVDDVARGTVSALGVRGFEIINLGSDRPVELNRVVRTLEEILGRPAVVDRRPRHPADVGATWADISKARDLLGWRPEVDLETGLELTVSWYLANRDWAKDVEVED